MRTIINFKWAIASVVFIVFYLESLGNETKMLHNPDINKDNIVFCYGGDIYISSIDGKNVKQLTSFSGEESLPKFSPDGKYIAFTISAQMVIVSVIDIGDFTQFQFLADSLKYLICQKPIYQVITIQGIKLHFAGQVQRL